MERRVDITDVNVPKTVQFSYSVEWVEENLDWKDRMTRYADSRFLPGSFEIHWLSIINSFVLVLLLTAFLTIILLRVLKNDFSRYMELDDDALEEEEVRPILGYCLVDVVTPFLPLLFPPDLRSYSLVGNSFTVMSFDSQKIPRYSVLRLEPETS